MDLAPRRLPVSCLVAGLGGIVASIMGLSSWAWWLGALALVLFVSSFLWYGSERDRQRSSFWLFVTGLGALMIGVGFMYFVAFLGGSLAGFVAGIIINLGAVGLFLRTGLISVDRMRWPVREQLALLAGTLAGYFGILVSLAQ